MVANAAAVRIVLVLALAMAVAHVAAAPAPPSPAPADAASTDDDGEALAEKYKLAQRALYDALRNDPSPRQQVLAGRLYIDSEDDTPTALRPKRADVVARAARLAPDDAFVQWMAADQGSYTSSQCGPTRWPETEVANLIRLEPDNAAALQFEVALAQAKGDQAAVDDALARMAAAPRADDHLRDEIGAWTRAYATHPAGSTMDAFADTANATPQAKALLRALQQTGFRSAPAESALETACSSDADSGRVWQRLASCADAGLLLATRGNSFVLREQGLKLLAASGATRDDLADLQRQFDWLKSNAANPMQNGAAFADAPSDLVADWQGAGDEIAATERRLERLGQPLTPPAGWVKADDDEDGDRVDAKAVRQSYQQYLNGLLDEMHRSRDPRERALALASARIVDLIGGATTDARTTADADGAGTLAALAAANPDNLLVQWIASTSALASSAPLAANDATAPVTPASTANVQRLDADNAAAWALSLAHAGAGDARARVLQRMAGSTRFDEHTAEFTGLWFAVLQAHPLPPALSASMLAMSPVENMSADAAGKGTAITMAYALAISAPTFSISSACAGIAAEAGATGRKESCTAIGRLMLHAGKTLIAASVGEALLRQTDAFDARDAERARQLAWWGASLRKNMVADGAAFDAYFSDYLATGSEIEASRLAATRSGAAEPPAGWKSPAEKTMARQQAKAAKTD